MKAVAAQERLAGPGVVLAVAAAAGLVASLGLLGADVLWTVPLGSEIAHGRLPHSLPFASAPTTGWHDVPAGGQLVLWALYHALGGYRGLLLAQVLAAAAGFGALAAGIRRETTSGGVLAVSAIVLLGALPAVVVVSVSLWSLALFPLLLWLLERDARAPGPVLWLAVPLLALWGNLHGGVLAGWGLLACYLVLARVRRRALEAIGILAAATVALFLDPALWRTPGYYRDVLGSEVARRATGLWAPLGTSGLDLLLVATGAALLVLAVARRNRIRLWEGVALVGLAAATVHVARTGVWFLFVAAYPAARALRLGAPRSRLLALAAIPLAAGALVGLVRGPRDPGSRPVAALAARTGQPVLATAVLGQQVALAGGRVWVSNPIDAFTRADQRLWLDWLDGLPAGAGAVTHARYVLVAPGSGAAALAARDRRLVLVRRDGSALLYRVRGI